MSAQALEARTQERPRSLNKEKEEEDRRDACGLDEMDKHVDYVKREERSSFFTSLIHLVV